MSAEVSGLAANMRLQRQLWLFAHIAVILTAATITVGILQLTSENSGSDGDATPTHAVPKP
jgi:hypothetical protein